MKKHPLTQWLSLAAASALTLLLGGFTHQTQAASFDPAATGDWDFYLTGGLKGVAHITFLANNTLSGIQIIRPGQVPNVPEVTGRGTIGVDPEDPRGVGTSNFVFLEVGGQVINGVWGYDFNGKLLGAFTLTSNQHTNGATIRGSGKTGKHMTLRVTRDYARGTVIYNGVPRVVLPDISGTYFVSGKKTKEFTRDSQPFTEIMTLTASGSSPYPSGTPNYYDVVKFGPGYTTIAGFAILTANKQLGIFSAHQSPGSFTNLDGLILTSLSGEFKTNKLSGKVGGYDGTNFLSLKIGSPPP